MTREGRKVEARLRSNRESLEAAGKGRGQCWGTRNGNDGAARGGLDVTGDPGKLEEEETKLACEATAHCEARTEHNTTAAASQAVIPSLIVGLL